MSEVNLPQDWTWVKLSSVGTFESGGTPSKKNPSFWGGNVPFVTGADVTEIHVNSNNARAFLTEQGLQYGKTAICNPGTILFVTRTRVGRVGIATEKMGASQDLSPYICGPRVLPEYVCRYLLTVSDYLISRCRGSTIRGLTRDVVQNLTIPLPPIAEQRRIAAILDKADGVRRKRKEAIALTEELLRSVFLEMFGDPVTNPKGWEVGVLGGVGTLDRGKSKHRPRNDPSLLGGPYPLIQTGDVSNSNGVITKYTQTYSEKGLAQSRIWPVGTLCITIAANIADTGMLAFDACFPDSVVGFKANESVVAEYVQGWFGFLQPIIEEKAPQVAQKNINLKILRELEIPVPPISLQERYAQGVRLMREHLLRRENQRKEVDNLFNSLLQRAFRGEL